MTEARSGFSEFGNHTNFLCQGLPSTVESFTTTFDGPDFMVLYERLTHDRPGTGAKVSLTESNWSITISNPHQRVFPDQPPNINIICGYALSPLEEGNYVRKSMYECFGEDILIEVLSYLNFPNRNHLTQLKNHPMWNVIGDCSVPVTL